jgi:hypothetical protein
MTSDTHDDATDDGTKAGAPMPVRYSSAIAVGGGLAAAVGSSFIPMNAIEGFVSAYGIAELLPAAAPPLGTTARLALSTGIGTLTAGALLALLPRGENDAMGYETAVKTDAADTAAASDAAPARAGAGVSRLAGWLRTLRFGKAETQEEEVTDFADLNRLRMRMADQHPDAPVRAPIMANSDLGVPFDSPAATEEPAADDTAISSSPEAQPLHLDASMTFVPPADPLASPVGVRAPSMRFAQPAEELPSLDEAIEECEPVAEQVSESGLPKADAPTPSLDPADHADLAQVAIPELLDRLERGLARRREFARGTPVDAGRQPVHIAAVSPLQTHGFAEAPHQAQEETPSRFRLRMAPAAASFAEAGEHSEDAASRITHPQDHFELEAPAVGSQPGQEDSQAAVTAEETPAVPAPPADEDMDVALRDALATLRQLSDRQRNA